MIWTVLAIFAAMAVKDVASNLSVYLVSKGHGLLGGIADGLSDVASVLSIGSTAVVTAANGVQAITILSFLALFAGSIVGGVVGTRLGSVAANRLKKTRGE